MRALRDQMRMKDGMHLVLDPGPVPHNLIAARDKSAHPLRCRIRGPDLRQVTGGMQARQRRGVDLVGRHVRMGDRLHLQRIGDHHSRDVGRQHAGDCHAVPRRLDHDLVCLQKLPAEPFQGVRVISTRPSCRVRPFSQITTSPKVGWMSKPTTRRMRASLASDNKRELRATRQLRIRALGATGRVAEAASY
ncbi:hypothetical protein GCM10008024_39290 [Allgaiera indica]|uniref:Uncharacterized protein n=1 Tax=Allgaiera indica TaxID=765699 RepID=A0AAN5A1S8_9RHOB|nr:hypothetical protein GCM10008024_39290 [Allgaiera indica]